jgi:hypothetical protein
VAADEPPVPPRGLDRSRAGRGAMLSRIIAGAGCVLACLTVPAQESRAERRPPPPPPSTSPATAVTPVAPPPPAAPEARPPSAPAEPSAPSSPPAETPPPANPSPTVPGSPSRVGQQIETPPATRTLGGSVAGPQLPPRPAAAPSSVPAPARIPLTGPGEVALPLAGAALTLGGLALIAGQPVRPGAVPVRASLRLLHQERAATTPSGPAGGRRDQPRRPGQRLWRRLGRR